MNRCVWAGNDPIYQAYHDNEWGLPTNNGKELFECLLLEGMQAGLSWITILKRREGMRALLHSFDPKYLAKLSDHDINYLLTQPALIRHRRKIEALRSNSLCYLQEFGSAATFSKWIWSFVDGKPIINDWQAHADIPAETDISRAMSKELKRKGFKFVGPVICYAFMQASGLVNDHTFDCDWHH